MFLLLHLLRLRLKWLMRLLRLLRRLMRLLRLLRLLRLFVYGVNAWRTMLWHVHLRRHPLTLRLLLLLWRR